MVQGKMTLTLLSILLIGHHVQAVVNKGSVQTTAATEEEVKKVIKADDRISNSYGPPSDDYGPPIGSGLNGPAPVYGPPELVGDHGPSPIYPPPPPDLPPVYGAPIASYGPPRNIKPHHGPPKQSFGLPLPSFGPKLHYGPPKQHYGPPPSFPSFRPPKPQYGPPLKFNAAPSHQYIPVGSSSHGPLKLGHGPSIPISLETYGPPPPKIPIPFNSVPSNDYGAPAPPSLSLPQPQYGPPAGDLYRAPPPAPPPGVPAPPTPPDIKYDGWQPIPGLTSQQGQIGDQYGPPSAGRQNFVETSSNSHSLHGSLNTVSENSNVPSDSYGVPIHNPEAQDLKSSVQESSGSSENSGLPPPPLPQFEPLHTDHQHPQKDESLSTQYELPKVEPLSIVKTVGFELLPGPGSLTSDLQGLSPSDGGSLGISSHNHGQHSFNSDSLSTLKFPSLDSSSYDLSLGNDDSRGYQNTGNDLSAQQLPVHAPSNTYGPPAPSVPFGKINSIESGIALPPPPPFDSYGAPPLSSYSPNGPYPVAQAGRASSSFGFHSSSFHKYGPPQSGRLHGSLRPPLSPPGSLIPPRNREPIKFKEPIPTGLLSNLNRYLPAFRPIDLTKPPKSFVPPISLGQQLPSLNSPLAFHKPSGFSNSFSNSHGLNSPIAAPNAQYGTPLSFGGFNTPAPILTYGAPNFGPATSFGSTSTGFGNNLYDSVSNTLGNTYGTPVANAPIPAGGGHDCGFPHSSGGAQYSLEDTGNHAPNLEAPGQSFGNSLPESPSTSVGGGHNALLNIGVEPLPQFDITPSVNHLELQNYDQQKADLKDSYGNPIGVTYESVENTDNLLSSDHSHSSSSNVANVISVASSQPQNLFLSGAQYQNEAGISAEALTASLTMQGFGQPKHLASNEVDASQFLKTDEGSEALSLAQGLTAESPDGFQIQGSKGTYTLQIQAADGGLGTENSDGSIRHDQVLSNGLLQDILAAIEQPDQGGHIQLQGLPEGQRLEKIYGDLSLGGNAGVPKGHFITVQDDEQKKGTEGLIEQANDRNEAESAEGEKSSESESVALFFNNQFGDVRKETRSVSKNEKVATSTVEDQKSASNTKTS